MTTTQLSLFDASPRDLQSIQSLFNSALRCLDSIPHINEGGCGIAALAIYRWCKENDIPLSDTPFVILTDDAWDKDRIDHYISNGEFYNAWFPHIGIEINGTVYDSSGAYPKGWEPCATRFGEDDLLYALNEMSGWNSDFSRERNLSIIEWGLEVDLSDVNIDWR